PQLAVPVLVRLPPRLTDQLACAGVDPLSLVVELGTLVDELVVGVDECDIPPPPPGRPQLIDLLDRCDERAARRIRLCPAPGAGRGGGGGGERGHRGGGRASPRVSPPQPAPATRRRGSPPTASATRRSGAPTLAGRTTSSPSSRPRPSARSSSTGSRHGRRPPRARSPERPAPGPPAPSGGRPSASS